MRPIDADEIRKKAIPHTRGERAYCADIRKWAVLVGDLDDAPTLTIDDLRPHGRWEMANNRRKSYIRRCSACKKEAYFCGTGCSYNYRPNCSAKMDGGFENG